MQHFHLSNCHISLVQHQKNIEQITYFKHGSLCKCTFMSQHNSRVSSSCSYTCSSPFIQDVLNHVSVSCDTVNRNWKVLRNRKMRKSQGRRRKCGTGAQCIFKLWMKEHQTFRLNLGCSEQQGQEEGGVQWKAVCNYSGSGVDDDFCPLLLGALETSVRDETPRRGN